MAISVEKRWEIIFAWKELQSIKKVARRVGVSPKVARLWVKRYLETKSVGELPKAGRPSLMSAKARARAYDMLKDGEQQGAAGGGGHSVRLREGGECVGERGEACVCVLVGG